MGRRGQNNGSIYIDCPFCKKRTGICNLMGRLIRPEGFPLDATATPHTITCWKERNKKK